MFFAQYYLDCLSQASYLVADETTGRAVVVDPRRDIDEYVADAEGHGFTIEAVINTHFHADFLAGHLELAARTGAWIGYGQRAETEYPIRHLADGERISLGEVTLQIMETPGHTPESISVLVYESGAPVRRRGAQRRGVAEGATRRHRHRAGRSGCARRGHQRAAVTSTPQQASRRRPPGRITRPTHDAARRPAPIGPLRSRSVQRAFPAALGSSGGLVGYAGDASIR